MVGDGGGRWTRHQAKLVRGCRMHGFRLLKDNTEDEIFILASIDFAILIDICLYLIYYMAVVI